MKRFALMLVLMGLLIPTLSFGQTTNPRGIAGSFTALAAQENEQVIFVARKTNSNRLLPAEFIYKFTVSDSCRVVFSSSTDNQFPGEGLEHSNQDDYVITYIPLTAGVEYSIDVSCIEIKLYRYGAATITYSGIVEYE